MSSYVHKFIRSFVIMLIVVALASPLHAAQLDIATVSSGGVLNDNLQSMAGQAAIGYYPHSGGNVEVGGIYAMLDTLYLITGPTINLSNMLLSAYAYVDPADSTVKMKWPSAYFESATAYPVPQVFVEARSSADKSELAGRTKPFALGATGEGSNLGEWEMTPEAEASYFLVVKQQIGEAKGASHLPVITSGAKDFTEPEIALSPADFQRPSAGSDDALDAFIALSTALVVRNGDLDANLSIIATDYSAIWTQLYQNYNSGQPEDPDLPYAIADINGDGNITAADYSAYWTNEYVKAQKASEPHSFAPKITK